MSTMARPGTSVDFRLYGTAGPRISLVHGGLVASPSWRHQLPEADDAPDQRLAARARLVVHDQRGYGATPLGKAGDGFDLLADDLVALWSLLDLDEVVVVGFSMGSMVALEAAARAPQRVAGIVLVSGGELDAAARDVFRRRAAEIAGGGFAAGVADHVRRAFSERYVAAHPREIADYTASARTADPRAVASTFRSIAAWEPPDGVPSAPVLLVNGSEDRLFTVAAAERLARRLPDARTTVVDGAGHTLHVERPDVFNPLVERFALEVTS